MASAAANRWRIAVNAPLDVELIPTYTRPVMQRKTAVVALLVDTSGAVETAVLSPLDPAYDRTVIAAARSWQYEPARVDGQPVKFQKRVQITRFQRPHADPGESG